MRGRWRFPIYPLPPPLSPFPTRVLQLMTLYPLKFLTLRVVHTEFPRIHRLQLKFPYPGTGSHCELCLRASGQVSCDSLYSHGGLSNLRAAICPVTSLLPWIRRVADFSIWSAFYFLLGWSGNFQFLTCWARNQKKRFSDL